MWFMTVVHIAYKYGEKNTGGAAIASTRLHKAMLRAGVNSHYICVHREESEGTNVYELPNGFKRKLFLFLQKFLGVFGNLRSFVSLFL